MAKLLDAPDFEVAILGTGFAGLCMAMKLRETGERRFVLLERAHDVGGTWRDNTYPGAACDVPSHLYSLSFAPNPDWSRTYPTQPELHRYLRNLAADHGILPHIRFGHALEKAEWDAEKRWWRLTTSGGVVTARKVVSGTGGLSEPKNPDIPGIETFAGTMFHSSRWRHDVDLAGKRVAVIGTGASAIQFVPEIAPTVGRLDVYQRTPNWIIPRKDRPYSESTKTLFRGIPALREAHRQSIYWTHEARVVGIVLHPALMKGFQLLAERHLKAQIPAGELRKKVLPNYTIGCKRVLISNTWYPALQRPNVALITEGIAKIEGNTIISTDGTRREVDVLVLATGFYATENPIGSCIYGRDGLLLSEAWKDGEEAYLGTLVKEFPNFFFIVGPNTGLGHSSMIYMIEAQVAYIQSLFRHMTAASATTLEVSPAVQDAYNHDLQKKLKGSIWATGCKSWYQHRSGKITALWPDFTFKFLERTQAFRASDYLLDHRHRKAA
jgi:cation diffusion facilitator CzcD-associated flavoprotein CzcO